MSLTSVVHLCACVSISCESSDLKENILLCGGDPLLCVFYFRPAF